MLTIYVHIGCFTASYLLYWISRAIVGERKLRQHAQQLGCEPAPLYRDPYPFGLGHLMDTIRADREQRCPDYIIEHRGVVCKQVGRLLTTYAVRGGTSSQHIYTIDPENIKAILATQLKEFGLSKYRIRTFAP